MIFAILLMLAGTFLGEQAAIKIKKYKELSVYQKAIFVTFFQALISVIFGYFFNSLFFKIDILSVGLSVALVILAIAFYYFVMKTIEIADRSTNSIFSVLVLPMLLISDLILGYEINIYQIIGVIFITLVLLISSYSGTLNLKGFKYIMITTFIAFFSTVIFKYQITHYTSVYTQLFIQSICSFFIVTLVVYKQFGIIGIKSILKKDYALIGFMRGLNTVLTSLAYMFGPASIISAFKRVGAMFWGVIFGKLIFHEVNLGKKLVNVVVLSFGVFFMNFQIIAANVEWIKDIQTSILKSDINGNTHIEIKYYIPKDKFTEQIKKSDIMVGF